MFETTCFWTYSKIALTLLPSGSTSVKIPITAAFWRISYCSPTQGWTISQWGCSGSEHLTSGTEEHWQPSTDSQPREAFKPSLEALHNSKHFTVRALCTDSSSVPSPTKQTKTKEPKPVSRLQDDGRHGVNKQGQQTPLIMTLSILAYLGAN